MNCGHCVGKTSELQQVDAQGHCPRCGRGYSAWQHTSKLRVQGDAYRDRLVAARINLRRGQD